MCLKYRQSKRPNNKPSSPARISHSRFFWNLATSLRLQYFFFLIERTLFTSFATPTVDVFVVGLLESENTIVDRQDFVYQFFRNLCQGHNKYASNSHGVDHQAHED